MELISEGLTDRAIQLYNMSRRLSSQLVTLNTSLEMTRDVINQARMEALVSRQLRNETHDSVMSTLNQVSQLQIASSKLIHFKIDRSKLFACGRNFTKPGGHIANIHQL